MGKTVSKILVLTLLIMIPVALIGYKQAFRYYKESIRLRLDPAESGQFGVTEDLPSVPDSTGHRIVLFGDSRIRGWSHLPDTSDSMTINRGVDGQTTAQLLLRLEEDVLMLKPDVVVIEAGINDLKAIGLFPERRDRIAKACFENIRAISQRVRQSGSEVVVLTTLPPSKAVLLRRPVWSDDIFAAVDDVNRQLLALSSDGVVVVNCGPAMTDKGRIKAEYSLNAFHLNDMGYEVLNRIVEPALSNLLKTLNK